MKKNMGSADKLIRFIIAIVVSVLYFTGTVTGIFGIILLIFAGVFLLTSVLSFCPLYTLLGINSCPVKK
ncbi:MAG: DUF2892 domain-containing protein [Ferruginibacter sp.]